MYMYTADNTTDNTAVQCSSTGHSGCKPCTVNFGYNDVPPGEKKRLLYAKCHYIRSTVCRRPIEASDRLICSGLESSTPALPVGGDSGEF